LKTVYERILQVAREEKNYLWQLLGHRQHLKTIEDCKDLLDVAFQEFQVRCVECARTGGSLRVLSGLSTDQYSQRFALTCRGASQVASNVCLTDGDRIGLAMMWKPKHAPLLSC
jgi:hypothetical protein